MAPRLAARVDPVNLALVGVLAAVAAALGLVAGIDPRMAIVASLALAFTTLTLASLTAGLVVFVFLSFIEVLPAGEGSGASAIRLIGLLLALSWLIRFVTREDSGGALDYLRAHPGHAAALALFVGWAVLTTTWALIPGESELVIPRYVLNLSLFPIVFAAVTRPQDARWVLWAFVLGAAASTAYGLTVEQEVGIEGRLFGAGVNPNEFAAQLVAATLIAIALASTAKRSAGIKLAAGTLALFCVFGLVLTLSRGGMLTLGVALLIFLLAARRQRGRNLVAALVAVLAVVGYFGVLAPPEARERITTVGTGTGRTDIWAVGWQMVEDRPITGVGAGRFRPASGRYAVRPGAPVTGEPIAPRGEELVAHNMYLEVLAELGLVGLVAFVVAIGAPMALTLGAAGGFARAGRVQMEGVARTVFAAQTAFLASGFFVSLQFNKQLWLLLALGPALHAIAARGRSEDGRAA